MAAGNGVMLLGGIVLWSCACEHLAVADSALRARFPPHATIWTPVRKPALAVEPRDGSMFLAAALSLLLNS